MAAMKAASAAGVNRLSETRRLIVACPVAQAGASLAPHTLYEYPVLAGGLGNSQAGSGGLLGEPLAGTEDLLRARPGHGDRQAAFEAWRLPRLDGVVKRAGSWVDQVVCVPVNARRAVQPVDGLPVRHRVGAVADLADQEVAHQGRVARVHRRQHVVFDVVVEVQMKEPRQGADGDGQTVEQRVVRVARLRVEEVVGGDIRHLDRVGHAQWQKVDEREAFEPYGRGYGDPQQ